MQNLEMMAMARRFDATRANAEAQRRASLGLRESEREMYSLSRAIEAMLDQKTRSGSFEAEISNALIAGGESATTTNSIRVPFWALRDLTASGVAGSQYLVGTSTPIDSFVDILRGRSVVASLGVTEFPGLVGNISIPRSINDPAVTTLQTEGSADTPTQGALGSIGMSPRAIACTINLSRQFSTQTGEGGARYTKNAVLNPIAMEMDRLALVGSGHAGEPLGLLNTPGIGSVSGSSLSEAGIREFQTDIGPRLGPDCGFVTTLTIASLLNGRQQFTGASTTLWTGNLYAGQMGGWPAYSAPSMPTGALVFGAWQSFAVASWGESIELALNPYAGFAAGTTAVRAIATFDVAALRPSAFALATSVT